MRHHYLLFIWLSFFILQNAKAQETRKRAAYAVIVSVPQVNDSLLHKKYDLRDTIFTNLPGACKDGERIYNILLKEGFQKENMVRLGTKTTDKITPKDILEAFNKINPKEDDLVVFYYSGHGFQVADKNGDEKDHKDEVLVTYDGFLVDDDINTLYRNRFSKTRNIMMIDACHAGTVFQLGLVSTPVFYAAYNNDDSKCFTTPETNVDEKVNMIYFGASKDENDAYDFGEGGYFTQALFSLYNKFWRSYTPETLACALSQRMKAMGDKNGKGLIQYAELGKLSKDFTNNYLFKIQ